LIFFIIIKLKTPTEKDEKNDGRWPYKDLFLITVCSKRRSKDQEVIHISYTVTS
jgi:hypothetical protein